MRLASLGPTSGSAGRGRDLAEWILPGRSAALSGRRWTGNRGIDEHQVVSDNCSELGFNVGGSAKPRRERGSGLWETAFDNSLAGHEGGTAIHS